MDMDDFSKKIVDVIASLFKISAAEISADTVAMDVDGWDSLTHTELILLIEEEIDRPLPIARVMDCENVGDLIEVARETSVTADQ
ncbi:phosphopantetheine-binding protein [Brevundimonas sp. NPDC058933]|uniref:phosphopantetheine-binding protein n=1 Tax=Brevundimonas sp. NPDC058933 TaxID=3346673 RepID=UPI003BEEC6D8